MLRGKQHVPLGPPPLDLLEQQITNWQRRDWREWLDYIHEGHAVMIGVQIRREFLAAVIIARPLLLSGNSICAEIR
jgi:hypothetical protein